MSQPSGKRKKAAIDGRLLYDAVDSTKPLDRTDILLDYIFANVAGDQRPHLSVNVCGVELTGLLDSGAN